MSEPRRAFGSIDAPISPGDVFTVVVHAKEPGPISVSYLVSDASVEWNGRIATGLLLHAMTEQDLHEHAQRVAVVQAEQILRGDR